MTLPLHIAKALSRLLAGEVLPASAARHSVIDGLVEDGLVSRSGRVQKRLSVRDPEALRRYLATQFQIPDMDAYIAVLENANASRAELAAASSDSKLRQIRTFKGFLVNGLAPIRARLNGEDFEILPCPGAFRFIYDYETFEIPGDVTVVGIENPENFRRVAEQRHLFAGIRPLFVSRYPQSQGKDLIRWLQGIPNAYLHFGDYDFAGLGIYLNEFKKHLNGKARLFVPPDLARMMEAYGNRDRYNDQRASTAVRGSDDEAVRFVASLIERYKKGLDQEIFIGGGDERI